MKCPNTKHGEINGSIHKMEYYSAIKNELLLPTTIQVKLIGNVEQNMPGPKCHSN